MCDNDPYDASTDDEPTEEQVDDLYESHGDPIDNSDVSGNVPDDDD